MRGLYAVDLFNSVGLIPRCTGLSGLALNTSLYASESPYSLAFGSEYTFSLLTTVNIVGHELTVDFCCMYRLNWYTMVRILEIKPEIIKKY